MNPSTVSVACAIDAPADGDWLYLAFGFIRQMVHAEGVFVRHAQLVLGNGVVMLGR